MVHSDLLSWSNDPLPPLLKSPTRYPACETHGQLKEALFKDMIDYFHRGKVVHWLNFKTSKKISSN